MSNEQKREYRLDPAIKAYVKAKMRLACNVDDFIKARGMSIDDLAAATGLPTEIMKQVHSGDAECDIEELAIIAVAIGMEISELFTYDANEDDHDKILRLIGEDAAAKYDLGVAYSKVIDEAANGGLKP